MDLNLSNLRSGTKLILAFSILILGFSSLLFIAQTSLQQIQAKQQELFQTQLQRLDDIKELRTILNRIRADTLALIVDKASAERLTDEAAIREDVSEGDTILKRLLEQSTNDSKVLALLQNVQPLWQELNRNREQQFQAIRDGRLVEAGALASGPQAERIEKIRAINRQLNKLINDRIETALRDSDATINRQRNLFLGAGLLLIAFALLVSWLLAGNIAKPLSQLTGWADQISRGEIPRDLRDWERQDEVGQLGQAFMRMGQYLQSLADRAEKLARGELQDIVPPLSERDVLGKAFATMVGSLRQLLQELHEGVAVLAAAAEEILAATSQVAASTQETATAISEIATTVDEVKQTAVLAGNKSKGVSDSTERNRQVSFDGRAAVEQTLSSMSQIREQMQAVAESIMRLGEQSQAIGEIVASVNDLAEQSNLLGVNASIEAVKAGEAGKGFSVVAQEVKTLAEQSKQATAQVRSILGDIQKAMTKAVLVAEQGSKAVEAGYERARVSGEAIRTLTTNIEASSEIALQIAAASQQQMVGMDQVASAMSNIRQASQDNVAGSRQVDQAARNLHELGLKLKTLAMQFRL